MEDSMKEEKKKSVKQAQRRRETLNRDEEPVTIDLTADHSTEEHARASPCRHQDMNTDMQINGSPDKPGGVNALKRSNMKTNANVGSQSHGHTDGYVDHSPDGREDTLPDLGADGHVGGQRETLCSSPNSLLTADGHRGAKTLKYIDSSADGDAGKGVDRQPAIRLFRYNAANGIVSTDKRADRRRQASHKPTKVRLKGHHSCPPSVDRRTGSDADAGLDRNADDQGPCLTNVQRQTKSPPEDAFYRLSDGGPDIHIDSPSSVTGGKVLDGAGGHVARCGEGDADLSAGVEQACRALSFEVVRKKPTPATPLLASSAKPLKGSGQTKGGATVRSRKDPYLFRTPTPPGTQSTEVLRKLRPFARTYESKRPTADGVKSMLCSLDRARCGVVRECDL